jgi:hypothetical protein
MMNDNHYTKDAYENNGRFQIHPLSPEGLEAYLSKDSYNYHYLKSKYDPALLKEIQQEVINEKEKEKISEQNNIINEQEKKEEIEHQNKIEEIKVEKNLGIKNKKIQNQMKKGNKQIKQVKQGSNNIKINSKQNSVSQKINNLGKSITPIISNVKNDRGKLGDFQQPYHA